MMMMMRPQRHGEDDEDLMAIVMDHDAAETRRTDDARKLLYATSRYRPKPARAGRRTNATAHNDTAVPGMAALDHSLADHRHPNDNGIPLPSDIDRDNGLLPAAVATRIDGVELLSRAVSSQYRPKSTTRARTRTTDHIGAAADLDGTRTMAHQGCYHPVADDGYDIVGMVQQQGDARCYEPLDASPTAPDPPSEAAGGGGGGGSRKEKNKTKREKVTKEPPPVSRRATDNSLLSLFSFPQIEDMIMAQEEKEEEMQDDKRNRYPEKGVADGGIAGVGVGGGADSEDAVAAAALEYASSGTNTTKAKKKKSEKGKKRKEEIGPSRSKCNSTNVNNGGSKKQQRPVTRREYDTPFDSKGRCHHHKNVQLAARKMRGGWKVLHAVCPRCMEEEFVANNNAAKECGDGDHDNRSATRSGRSPGRPARSSSAGRSASPGRSAPSSSLRGNNTNSSNRYTSSPHFQGSMYDMKVSRIERMKRDLEKSKRRKKEQNHRRG